MIARVRVEYSHSHESVLGSYACRIDAPRPGDVVESPLVVRGEARGTWYFEADFPVVLVDWDGLIIAEGAARAEQDWMTEDFVPFRAELSFESPYEKRDPDFMQRGTLILQRANPSGLPENDAAVEVPLRYRE
ncbi:MAG: Gmad2 immunoglobulin-like domain-containing protein [Spirochaetota bacterium]